MKTHLLVIDPQNDFCDPDTGALYVPGAEADMDRLAALIDRIGPNIDAIHVTLDSHHLIDIAHPVFWRDAGGAPPDPFTAITAEDVTAGKWTTRRPADRDRALAYLEALEETGRYPHTIWPPHCLIGTPGHNVWPALAEALVRWQRIRMTPVDYVLKGDNPWTEHFSAVRAEVPDPDDPASDTNARLVEALKGADRVLIAGEAGSHCVANTVRDLADALGGAHVEKLVLIEDAISPVSGFEHLQADFVRDLGEKGMRRTTSEAASAT